MSGGSNRSSSANRTTKTTTTVQTESNTADASNNTGTVVTGKNNTVLDGGAIADSFDFAEGVLLKSGDLIVDIIEKTTQRDEKVLTSLATEISTANSDRAADASTTKKLIEFGTIAAVATAAAVVFKKGR